MNFDFSKLDPIALCVLGIGVFILTFFIRRICETAWPVLKPNASAEEAKPLYVTKISLWWNTIIIYAIPVLLGAGLTLAAPGYFRPDTKSAVALTMYGCCIGWFSGFIYTIVLKMFMAKIGAAPAGPYAQPPGPPEVT